MEIFKRIPAASLLLAASLLVGQMINSSDANAQQGMAEPAPRIVVTGEGSAELAPDMAVLTLTVSRQAEKAREAVSANSEAMNRVIDALKKQGIAARDLQTANFSIQPQYTHLQRYNNEPGEARKFTGYQVRNTLTVRVRNIDKLGEVLDNSITQGVNQGGNIAFTNDDPSEALSKARTRAVSAATDKAKTLAAAAGVKLGRVLEISEHSYNSGPRPMARGALMAADAEGSVPIAQGENSYQVSVNMTFAIAP